MGLPLGLVLAGGAGRRIGRPKGGLRLNGVPLARRAAEALEPLCEEVWISLRPGARNPAPGYRALADPLPVGRGPLAGIAAAFEASGGRDLLVLACDYPMVDTALLARLVAEAGDEDVTLFRDGEQREHPLVARWRGTMREAVREALAGGRHGVLELLARHRVRRLDAAEADPVDAGRALWNLNRPEDLARLGKPGD